MSESLLLSFSDAAKLLSVSRAMLYTRWSDGRLGVRVHKIGRRSLIRRDELQAWVLANMPPRIVWEKVRGNNA